VLDRDLRVIRHEVPISDTSGVAIRPNGLFHHDSLYIVWVEAGRWHFEEQAGRRELTIPVGDLPSGMYLLTVQAGTRTESQQIVVVR
jgi:hypothetical protein